MNLALLLLAVAPYPWLPTDFECRFGTVYNGYLYSAIYDRNDYYTDYNLSN